MKRVFPDYLQKYLRTIFVLLLCLISPASLAAQERKIDWSELEQVVSDELKETNTPGAAVYSISETMIR